MALKIYINPGHCNKDPGAVGYETERVLNVKVSDFMKEYLLNNYECEIRMNPGTMGNLSAIAQDANDWGADLFVSNHFNAGGGDGYEALVYSSNSKELGQIFDKHVKAIGQNSRGVKYRPGLAVLKRTHMPAVLNEGAFVDNKKDISDWNDDVELKKMGEAYAKAAAEYLKLEKKVIKNVDTSLVIFVKNIQKVCGAAVDGIAGPETLSKTPTLSAKYNKHHAAVKFVQQRLLDLGYAEVGTADGVAGPKFTSAVAHFQDDNGCVADGYAVRHGNLNACCLFFGCSDVFDKAIFNGAVLGKIVGFRTGGFFEVVNRLCFVVFKEGTANAIRPTDKAQTACAHLAEMGAVNVDLFVVAVNENAVRADVEEVAAVYAAVLAVAEQNCAAAVDSPVASQKGLACQHKRSFCAPYFKVFYAYVFTALKYKEVCVYTNLGTVQTVPLF